MIEFLAKEFIGALEHVKYYAANAHLFEEQSREVQNKILHCDLLIQAIMAVEAFAIQLPLVETHGRCQRLSSRLRTLKIYLNALEKADFIPIPSMGGNELTSELDGIKSAVSKELGKVKFASINPTYARYFEQEALFEQTVFKNFLNAREDIKEAGNCLAADLGTAAIFHLMRVVEIGLRALAKDLQVPIPVDEIEYKQWQFIIDQIRAAIKTKTICASMPEKEKAAVREFYNGLVGDFECFKDVWRNNIMHCRRPYTTQEARAVFDRVGEFMQRMSNRISE